MNDDKPTGVELAEALGVNESRVSQLKREGMPTSSIEEALAWRAARHSANVRAGNVSVPIQPISISGLDDILNTLSGTTPTGDADMDTRITQQAELCRLTREQFTRAAESGDPSQSKLYSNFDRAIATLLRLERERSVRLQESGRLVDADAAASRYGKILGQLRSLIERAELIVAPRANPENPTKALKAFREFRDDLFRKLNDYNPQVVSADVSGELSKEIEQPTEDGEQKSGGSATEWEEPATE
jgi:hypothetical protein